MAVVRVEHRGEVVVLTLDRPARRNALSEAVREELQRAIDVLSGRAAVRVVVLAGEGTSFSAGADLDDRPAVAPDAAARRLAAGRWQRLLEALERLPQVTVARLHGHVIGGAALLAAACDLRVAATDVSIRIPELALGIPLTWGGLPRLAREMGLPRTRELVMTGRTLGAEEAQVWGFVHRLAARDSLDAAVDGLVAELLAQPAGPLALTVAATRALGRASAAAELSWADADLLRWSLRELGE